jgi:hypothetical protein
MLLYQVTAVKRFGYYAVYDGGMRGKYEEDGIVNTGG